MARRHDIDRILEEWPFEPGEISARLVRATDGREVLQMRVEMGVLQLETQGRPDGLTPGGAPTYFEYLLGLADNPDLIPDSSDGIADGEDHAKVERESAEAEADLPTDALAEEASEAIEGEEEPASEDGFVLSADQCTEADREFMQFYHRRVCWLALREFRRAATDADHTLAFMDFVRDHSPNEEWTLSHEQYRPFVLFHRTQAAALATLEESSPEAAMRELNDGLAKFRDLFSEYDAEDQFEDDDLVVRLVKLRNTLREQYDLKPSLSEQLADAVATEQYELAAKLRDEMSRSNKSA